MNIKITFHRRLWNWVTLPFRSWIAHTLVSVTISSAVALLFSIWELAAVGYAIGAVLAALYFMRKEYFDYKKYEKAGTWEEQQRADSGVSNKSDGVADLLGPLAHAIGAVVVYILGVV